MKSSEILVLLLLSSACVSCTTVRMKQPLSATSTVPNKEQYAGVWCHGDGSLQLNFDTAGVGHFGILEWKENAYVLEKGVAIFTHCSFGDYLSVYQEGEDEVKEYLLAECTISDEGYLVVWPAIPEFFALAVKEHRLEGTVSKSDIGIGKVDVREDVLLDGPPEKIIEFLEKHAEEMAFAYKEPMIFKRLSEVEKPSESAPPPESEPNPPKSEKKPQ